MANGNRRGLTNEHLVEILNFLREMYLRDDGADDKNAIKNLMGLALRDMRDTPNMISRAALGKTSRECAIDHACPVNELALRIIAGEDMASVFRDNVLCKITRDEHTTLEQAGFRQTREVCGKSDWQECYKLCGIELANK